MLTGLASEKFRWEPAQNMAVPCWQMLLLARINWTHYEKFLISRKRTLFKRLPDKWETALGDLLGHRAENPLHAPYLSSTAVGLTANARRKRCFLHYRAAHWLLSRNTWVGDQGWWVLIVLIINKKEASQTLENEHQQHTDADKHRDIVMWWKLRMLHTSNNPKPNADIII